MQKKLEEQILNLIKTMKQDERKIKGKKETEAIEDVRYIENALEIDGEWTNIICMVLNKGKDETSYRYYINNELVCVVDSGVSTEPIFTNSRIKEKEALREKLRLLIQTPEKYGKEEISIGHEIEENERLVLKIAKELGISKQEVKRIAILDTKQKIEQKREEEQNKGKTQKVHEDDLKIKQNIKASTKVNEMQTLRQVMKLPPECEKIVIIESDEMDKIDEKSDITTRYSLVGINKDKTVTKLEGIEQDMSVGNNPTQDTYKLMHDGDLEKNAVLSRFKINGTNATLSVKNGDMGRIEAYMSPDKTREKNESFDKQLETDNVWPIKTEIRDVAGYYSKDGYRAVDEVVNRAEQTNIEDKDNTEYRDVDEHEETFSENTKQLEEIGLDDEFEYNGKNITIREYAKRNGYENLNEILSMFKQSNGTAEERLEEVDEQINEQYRGTDRKR